MWVKLVDGLGYSADSMPTVLTDFYWIGGSVDPNCDWLINNHEWQELFGVRGPELLFMEEPAYNSKVNTAKIIWLLKNSI